MGARVRAGAGTGARARAGTGARARVRARVRSASRALLATRDCDVTAQTPGGDLPPAAT